MPNSLPPATPTPPLKQITFAFPFRKKGQGDGSAAVDFSDEHAIFQLLKRESAQTAMGFNFYCGNRW